MLSIAPFQCTEVCKIFKSCAKSERIKYCATGKDYSGGMTEWPPLMGFVQYAAPELRHITLGDGYKFEMDDPEITDDPTDLRSLKHST